MLTKSSYKADTQRPIRPTYWQQ